MEFKHFTLVAVYVPNSGENLRRLDYRTNEWDRDFHAYLQTLESKHDKPVIIAGDLNVAHHSIDIFDTKLTSQPGFTSIER